MIKIGKDKIKNLEQIKLPRDIENTESKLYHFNAELLKVFKTSDKKILENKLYVLRELLNLKKNIDFDELVFPNKIIEFNDKLSYTMDYIKNNINIKLLLQDNSVSIDDKLKIVYDIGKIIEKVERNELLINKDFHLGDIHEGNFILDKVANKVKRVDIDSSYMLGSVSSDSKFLALNKNISGYTKYPLDSNGKYIPNYNSTILCFIYILLNFITDDYIPIYSIDKYNELLNILESVGFDKRLCDSFETIYKENSNYLDLELVKSINPKLILKYKNKKC